MLAVHWLTRAARTSGSGPGRRIPRHPATSAALSVCLVYDCVFPYTVGGAERWYRELAAELVASGHRVTYLSRLQWDGEADLPGVDVVAVSRREELYDARGHRRPGPPVRFGLGVLRHLLRHRSSYDVVHTCGFPYFPVLAIRLALAGRCSRPRVVVEWVEVWSSAYWRDYLGPLGGRIGAVVQAVCIRLTPLALVHSRLYADRLHALGYRGPGPVRLGGLYSEPDPPPEPRTEADDPPVVLFAGRHIPDKQAHLVPAVVALARRSVPGLRGVVLGDGPERPRVEAAAREYAFVEVPGFVSGPALTAAMAGAACLLQPSRREGHGMVVVEAAALGTPTVVAAGPDNAATELVEPGVNGAVAADASLEALAAAVVQVVRGGAALRASTAQWYAAHRDELSVAASVRQVLAAYERADPAQARSTAMSRRGSP